MSKISFVGGGNMAIAILSSKGISNNWKHQQISIAEPQEETRSRLEAKGYAVVASPQELPESDAVFLCTKPQDIQAACEQLGRSYAAGKQTGFISIAAGISTARLISLLGSERIVRVMPNTPLLVGAGCSFSYTNLAKDDATAMLAAQVFNSCGSFTWVDKEELIDAATALSGSGPAYAYMLIEAMAKAGAAMGLDEEAAMAAAIDTVAGAAAMAKSSSENPASLRAKVTSKGGTTSAAIEVLEQQEFVRIIADAMSAAHNRSKELAESDG